MIPSEIFDQKRLEIMKQLKGPYFTQIMNGKFFNKKIKNMSKY